MQDEDLIRKIRKLLALSESPNGNEAAAAAAKARKLLLEHGLTMESIGKAPGEVGEEVWRNFAGPRNTIVGLLAATVTEANMCKLIGARNKFQNRWILAGRPAAIEAAKAQLDYIYEAMERNAKEKSAGRGRAWMNDYRLAFVIAIKSKLHEEKKSDTVEERGLILRQDAAVTKYLDALNLKNDTAQPRAPQNEDAVKQGYMDGSRLQLAKQLAKN